MNQNIHSINNSSIIDEKIPKGYKKTSVGTIPEDWSVKTLGKLGEFKNGLNKSSGDFGSGQEMVNLNDVFEKRSLNSLDSFSTMVKCNQKEINEYSLKQGDVLFVRSSVKPEGVGLTTLIEEDLNDKVYSGFIIRYRDKGDDLELYYKKYCFDATYFRRKLLNYSTISANTNINQKSLEKLEVIIPSKAEQKEIASILSVWDKAIELKEKLIEQKKEQKKGLMQKLLTGEVRLPGFGLDWKEVRLGSILKERKETGYDHLELLAITSRNGVVRRTEVDIKDNSSENKSKYKRILPNDIGYNTMRMWQGVSGVSKYEGIVSPAYTILKPTEKVS